MTQRFLAALVLAFGQIAVAQVVAVVPRISPAHIPEQPASPPEGLLRVDSALVLIPAHVTNRAGNPVTDLGLESFHLYEDDVEQTIASFSAEDEPVSVGLLFDSSGSMRNKMDKASEAAARFFTTANTDDEFFLIQISGRPKLIARFSSDTEDLLQKIHRFRPGGQTPLFDSIHMALKQMRNARNNRKAVVILSDGGDNWSTHTFRQIREDLIESDVQVYAIGIFDDDFTRNHSPEEAKGPMLLNALASQTGGRLFSVTNLDDLPDIGAQISRQLRQQYVLGYYPRNETHDGKYRRVKVKLSLDRASLRVSFRTGYYAPNE